MEPATQTRSTSFWRSTVSQLLRRTDNGSSRTCLTARYVRRMAAHHPHDSTFAVDDGRAAIDSLRQSISAIPGRNATQLCERWPGALLGVRNVTPGWPPGNASRLLLDCIRLYDYRVAYTADVSTGTQFANMACRRARMFSHDRSALLVADNSTLSAGPANAALEHYSVPLSRGFSEHRALGIPDLLRACALSGLRDRSAHRRHDGPRRSGGSRRNHVGGKFDLFPDPGRDNYYRGTEPE